MDYQGSPYEFLVMELHQISHKIIENANFGVIVVDPTFKIKFLNQAACLILAVSDKIIGNNLEEAINHVSGKGLFEKGQSGKELSERGLSEKGLGILLRDSTWNIPPQIEVEINGETKLLEICVNQLLGPAGAKEGIVYLIYDVTLKEKENRLLQENIQLATVGKLASEVAHELKNPITVIKGFSQLLLKKAFDDPQVNDFLEIIYKEAEHAHLFIQDFLNLGRTRKPHKMPINLPSLISDAVTEIEKQCYLNGIEIIQQIEPSCKTSGDYDQLKQALINLGKNAVEAMEHTSTAKKLTFLLSRDRPNNRIYIKVIDTGCGISPQMLDKIFNPFFTTKKYGTGLGLNITKNIIERHDGKLTFVSSPQGTTATIELPGDEPDCQS